MATSPASSATMAVSGRYRTALLWLLCVAVYGLLAYWAAQFTLRDPAVPMIWPATGVALAFMLRFGFSVATPLFLVGAGVQLSLGVPLPQAMILGAGAVAAAAAGTWLLRALLVRHGLDRVRDVLWFLGVGLGVSAVFSGVVGTLTAVGLSPAFPETLGLCWLADSMGLLLFAPLLLTILPRPQWSELLRPMPLVLLPPVVAYAAYALGLSPGLSLPLSYLVFPLVMWIALRHGAAPVTLSVALVAMVAVACTASGKGPFAQSGMQPDLISLHAQLALLQITGLLLAAVRGEAVESEQRERGHLRTLARIGRLNAMSAMAAGLAHEINQPLCAVSSYAQTARRMLDRGTPPAALADTLARIADGTERASDIVRRARRFLQSGDSPRAHHDLRDLLRESVDLVRPELRRQGITVQFDLGDRAMPVWADALEIQQVCVNLLQNAEEAMVTADRAPRDRWLSIRARQRQAGRGFEVAVIDNGPGLPAENIAQLFEPLVSHRDGGTGLGLAIARLIIESHGGQLTASNSPGAGAVFQFTLPEVDGIQADAH